MMINISELSKCTGLDQEVVLKGKRYRYQNNGSNVLAVCHLDTVQKPSKNIRKKVRKVKGGTSTLLYNPVWDDRLGLYTMVYYLPNQYKIKMDWLFCTDEEIGNSSATDFVADYLEGSVAQGKTWNWMVEFDRMGSDTAVYNYGDNEFKALLTPYFGKITTGSFTDITGMQELGIKGFNVGVGYENNHSLNAHMVLETYLDQIEKFVAFYRDYSNVSLPHTPVKKDWWSRGTNWWNKYDSSESLTYYVDTATECAICANPAASKLAVMINGDDLYLCGKCLNTLVNIYYDLE